MKTHVITKTIGCLLIIGGLTLSGCGATITVPTAPELTKKIENVADITGFTLNYPAVFFPVAAENPQQHVFVKENPTNDDITAAESDEGSPISMISIAPAPGVNTDNMITTIKDTFDGEETVTDLADSTVAGKAAKNFQVTDGTSTAYFSIFELTREIIDTYNEAPFGDRSKLLNYFIQKRLKNLTESIGEF